MWRKLGSKYNQGLVIYTYEYLDGMVAWFCHHLSDRYVDLLDRYVDFSDNYVNLSCFFVDLGIIHVFFKQAFCRKSSQG